MPSSMFLLDDKIKSFLKSHPEKDYLDVGAGDGKFGKMIRNLHKARIVAVEPDNLPLKDYDKVLRCYAIDVLKRPDFITDVVIMGDVIEHMRKSEGIDFINYMYYRSKYIIVKFPFYYPQFGDRLERHVSVWNFDDFDDLNLRIIRKETEDFMGMVILEGLIKSGGKHVESLFKKARKI